MASRSDETYVSPLMSRLKEQEVLSLDTLAKYVPLAQAGFAARAELENTTDRQKRNELMRVIAQGEAAKEKLVLIAMPLIKTLAHKEYRRRRAWNSRVPLDDIISEGLSGLLRGIRAYNVAGSHTSPTNYLGQWILTDMRRNIEDMEHDFSIPYEAMERQRKIRAIRSRLSAALGREPTDEEIIEAATDTSYGDSMMGRANKVETPASKRRSLTQKHLDEERDMYTRTGAMHSTHVLSGGDEVTFTEDSLVRSVTDEGEEFFGDISIVEERAARAGLSRLIEDAFNLLSVGEGQRDIIRRRFGLTPYPSEQTIKEITLHTGVPKHKINRVLTSFSAEMSTPNGRFHELVWRYGPDEVQSMGMGWLLPVLGEFNPPAKVNANKDLVAVLLPSKTTTSAPRRVSHSHGVIAYFVCPYHDMEFSSAYETEEDVPLTRSCPHCSRQSPRVS